MQKPSILLLCSLLAGTGAHAGTYEWTSGWGMGVSEHLVDDGNGNELNISCPDHEEDGYVRAHASIGGRQYSSDEGNGFDVIVDGETYSNPFFTDCRVCGTNFPGFWEALRKANNLKLAAGGQTVNLPTKSISSVLQPLGSPENSCHSAW
ncbi:hypothetical protein E8E95_10925 [Pseudomonas sp. BN414]|uniref:hypothetical protein n=1 Tax=Pseudomonas sp. BN414 TaxID=2567888 RepID=UPI0024543A23|nr:hypothetical protein [Pseudomonas sp. BN414]MDH4567192.1 hypothetical protein [Pseudomonas sp. BN414]